MPANPDRPGRNRDTGHLCAAFSCSATPSATRHRSTSLSGRASPRACDPKRYTALSGTARCIASRHRASVSRWSRSDSGSLSNNSLTPQTLRQLAVHRQARIMGRVKSSPVPRRPSFTLRKGRTRLTTAYLRWGRSGSRIPAVAARAGPSWETAPTPRRRVYGRALHFDPTGMHCALGFMRFRISSTVLNQFVPHGRRD
jgi:hypothetical protein